MAVYTVPQVGSKVRYRSGNRVRAATVLAVSGTDVDLRIGRGATAASVSAAPAVARRGSTTGWIRGGR
jgi:hypothetical protein